MRAFRKLGAIAALVFAAGMPSAVVAQGAAAAWPSQPIRFIVPASAGGPSDAVARMFSDRLSQALGRPVVVDHRPGAGQVTGTAAVAKAAPDGYTMLFTSSTPIVMMPFTNRKTIPYDVRKEFTAVSHVGSTPLVLFANAAVPVGNVKEMVEYVKKAKPNAYSFGSHGVGSSAHVLLEILARQTGMQLTHVPYKGTAPIMTDVAGGQIAFGIGSTGSGAAFVKDGRMKILAVTGSGRSADAPEVPTFAEQGIRDMEPFSPWFGLFAPAATPKAIVDRVSAEMERIAKLPEVRERLLGYGVTATGYGTAEATRAMNQELDRWEGIVGSLSHISFE